MKIKNLIEKEREGTHMVDKYYDCIFQIIAEEIWMLYSRVLDCYLDTIELTSEERGHCYFIITEGQLEDLEEEIGEKELDISKIDTKTLVEIKVGAKKIETWLTVIIGSFASSYFEPLWELIDWLIPKGSQRKRRGL